MFQNSYIKNSVLLIVHSGEEGQNGGTIHLSGHLGPTVKPEAEPQHFQSQSRALSSSQFVSGGSFCKGALLFPSRLEASLGTKEICVVQELYRSTPKATALKLYSLYFWCISTLPIKNRIKTTASFKSWMKYRTLTELIPGKFKRYPRTGTLLIKPTTTGKNPLWERHQKSVLVFII